jgi:nicotinate-nucleotide--dimethylbenzimidazole phosphoribosyltransferase
MSEAETLDALRRGAEAVDPEADVLMLGEMGIGNSTIAAALACACSAARPRIGSATGLMRRAWRARLR